ncbi:MAG TPA: riboflavin synthase [Anaerohalosphaeraceae bacterium]|nr:riboflavin synthase [Anaerohalosphaeraceae bacterium]
MFTGIIESIGTVLSVVPRAGGMMLTVRLGAAAEGTKLGDSIAVNGVCLTVTSLHGDTAGFDVSGESLSRSTLNHIRTGQIVNLERAMQAGARFGGHVVQGHVDGVGKIVSIEKKGDFSVFTIEPPAELMAEIVVKGSVALDGISLTAASVTEKALTAALIPETLVRTTWGRSKAGDAVNIETDILVKAIRKQLERIVPAHEGLTESKLRELGF